MKVGIDIGGSHIAIGVIDSNSNIVEKTEKRLISKEKKDFAKIIEEYIIENVKQFKIKYKITELGMAIPGRAKDGVIVTSGNLGIENYPIVENLGKLELPIEIQNDAKCAALAEKAYGSLKGYDRSVFLTLGTGIGGAAFLGGQLFGAEFGHMVIDKNGIPCHCGRNGCFERYASMKVFKNNLRQALGVDETTRGQELIDIIRKNQPNNANYQIVEDVVSQFIQDLSTGILNLIDIFNPEIVVIGGSFVYFEEVLLTRLREKIAKKHIKIETAILGNDAGVIGATLK